MRDWKVEAREFENFLKNIDLQKYAHFRQIKTIEQDLPNELLPLEIYYQYYWDTTNFKDYDEIFEVYWREKLNPYIYEFIKKYFYGCSLRFVEEGFKARLYRIWMSLLTQFHYQYLWNALFKEKLSSNAKLDKMGIDAIVQLNNMKVAIQVKKISYRREVSERRFTKRQQNYADVIVEVPYLVVDIDELQAKLSSPRTKENTKIKCQKALEVFNKNFVKLDNGFVIFRRQYLKSIYQKILQQLSKIKKGMKISYEDLLEW